MKKLFLLIILSVALKSNANTAIDLKQIMVDICSVNLDCTSDNINKGRQYNDYQPHKALDIGFILML
tara:strand:- start:285 stop:485 length:201 start_codon:yes stop_codon:yes gene_type:complete